ncbi:MAG: asparagine synthetase B, partial [Flavobacteriales bacterium]|nr:asparagine synthetase B [Flavobacteriales bacterium]
MCGIAGIVGENWHEDELRAMLDIQEHRGPDAKGFYVEPGNIALGHNRLSIIDLSEAGNQPMSDLSEQFRIVFNGEIYNYLEL